MYFSLEPPDLKTVCEYMAIGYAIMKWLPPFLFYAMIAIKPTQLEDERPS